MSFSFIGVGVPAQVRARCLSLNQSPPARDWDAGHDEWTKDGALEGLHAAILQR